MFNHQNASQARDTEAPHLTLSDDELRHVLGGGTSDPPVVPDIVRAGSPLDTVIIYVAKEILKAVFEQGASGPTQSGGPGNGTEGAGGAGDSGGSGGAGGASGR